MTGNHRLLHRVQFLVRRHRLQVFDREQRLAVERRQELDAGVDGFQVQAAHRVLFARRRCLADHHRAGTAIAFVAAFFRAGAARVFAQPIEHGAGGRGVAHLDHGAAVEEADRAAGRVVWHGRASRAR